MGFFGRLMGKKDEDFSTPDFSQPVDPMQESMPPTSELSQDPFQHAMSAEEPGDRTNFNHEIFRTEATSADNARAYARSLTPNQAEPGAQPHPAIAGHEQQIILERLDTIKAELDSIKQRMMRIERFMDESEKRKKVW